MEQFDAEAHAPITPVLQGEIMHGLALLLAAASVGVDYGWQPGPDGALEYIIQLDP